LLNHSQLLPHPTLENLSDKTFSTESAKAVWVPNRNGVFIEIAAGIAEDLGANAIIVGFNREEGSTFPDNTKQYMEAITKALSFSTSNAVQVISPTVSMEKSEIVSVAKKERFPFNLLWSCYEADERMCGRCESCMRLKRALKTNEVDFHDLFKHPQI